MRCHPATLGLAFTLCWIAGCSTEIPSYRCTGAVTLDDKPVPDGDIHFRSKDGRWGAEAGKIKDGKYELMAKAGTKRVEISASRIMPGGARGAGGEPVAEEYIPEEYNLNSTLSAEVISGSSNQFDFALKSKKKK